MSDKKTATSKELFDQDDKNNEGATVMISYSRKDKAFVKNIYDALAIDDRLIWVDWEDILPVTTGSTKFTRALNSQTASSLCYLLIPTRAKFATGKLTMRSKTESASSQLCAEMSTTERYSLFH